MKKIGLFLAIICCLLVTGCGSSNEEKVVKTLNYFQAVCTSNGFVVTDNMNGYQDNDYITGSMKATSDNIEIEMVTYDSEDNATKAHDNHIKVFNNMKGSGATLSKDKGKNYYKYDMVSNGYYMVSIRVGNTLVFSKTQVANKEKVEKVLNEMNY